MELAGRAIAEVKTKRAEGEKRREWTERVERNGVWGPERVERNGEEREPQRDGAETDQNQHQQMVYPKEDAKNTRWRYQPRAIHRKRTEQRDKGGEEHS